MADYELGKNDAVLVKFERVVRETEISYDLLLAEGIPTVRLRKRYCQAMDAERGHAYVPRWWAEQEELSYE